MSVIDVSSKRMLNNTSPGVMPPQPLLTVTVTHVSTYSHTQVGHKKCFPDRCFTLRQWLIFLTLCAFQLCYLFSHIHGRTSTHRGRLSVHHTNQQKYKHVFEWQMHRWWGGGDIYPSWVISLWLSVISVVFLKYYIQHPEHITDENDEKKGIKNRECQARLCSVYLMTSWGSKVRVTTHLLLDSDRTQFQHWEIQIDGI